MTSASFSSSSTIVLPLPAHFSWAECLHFLDRDYEDCLYTIINNEVWRPVMLNGHQALLQLHCDGIKLLLTVHGASGQAVMDEARGFITEWFDLDRNLQPFYNSLGNDQRLAHLSDSFAGLRLMRIPDLLEALCWCIIGQQINLTFAYRVKRQLVETYGSSIEYSGRTHYFFPRVDVLASRSVPELKALQFSRQKAEYTIGVANEIANGGISKSQLLLLDDTAAVISRLKEIRGVGPWTANYVAMKCLGRPNCVPFGDTGIQSVLKEMLELNRKPTRAETEAFFNPHADHSSYLTTYLWRTLSA